jgi:hypothetical protein
LTVVDYCEFQDDVEFLGNCIVKAPASDLHAATKKYVDDESNFTAGTGLSLSSKQFSI